MKLQYWTLLGLSCCAMTVSAQHQHSPKCAVTAEQSELIKQRMIEQRNRITPEQIAQIRNQRGGTIYIPLTLHIVGDANGAGRIDMDEVLDMFCGLQNDYNTQNIQYYLNGQFRFLNNTSLYNNAFTSSADNVMTSNKVSNSMNAYAGPSVNDPSASFYSPSWGGTGDYVFLLNAQIQDASALTAPTTSHEFGHFFTLAHTFSGWENTSYDQVYAGANAPNSIGGQQVEKVARTGGSANCASAADGFCDTPADYFSDRTPCPYTATAKDPLGVQLDPDETNLMSYFYDACVNNFTVEQKDAIAADIVSRGWTGFTPPTTALIASTVQLTAPAHNSQVNLQAGSTITLTWDAVPNATGYYIEVDRSFNGSPIEEIARAIVYNTTTYNLSTANLLALKQYRWRIRPFNAYHMCPGFDAAFQFLTISTPVGVEDVANAAGLVMEAMPNPVNGDEVRIGIQSNKEIMASLRLFSTDGKMFINLENQLIQAGESYMQLPTDALPNGLYILTLTSEAGSTQQKIVVAR